MRLIVVCVLVATLLGCAVVDDPQAQAERAKKTPFEVIDDGLTYGRVEHGIITVREVQPRSDIVTLPPSVEHVVWQRDAAVATTAATPATKKNDTAPTEVRERRVVDDWALLAEDMDFGSEIGRVDMCKPTEPCYAGSDCPDLVPCERADELACYRVKQGDYCVEIN